MAVPVPVDEMAAERRRLCIGAAVHSRDRGPAGNESVVQRASAERMRRGVCESESAMPRMQPARPDDAVLARGELLAVDIRNVVANRVGVGLWRGAGRYDPRRADVRAGDLLRRRMAGR